MSFAEKQKDLFDIVARIYQIDPKFALDHLYVLLHILQETDLKINCNMKNIIISLDMKPSDVSRICQRLEQAKLINIKSDKSDKRVKNVTLSKKCLEILEK